MILHLLRALRRLVSRRATSQSAPAENVPAVPDSAGGTWVPIGLAVEAWAASTKGTCHLVIGNLDEVSMEWQEIPTPTHGWIVNFGPGVAASIDPCYAEPTPLDAIAARFDAAVDEAARGRNVPPRA